jgi:hypothetical protein
LGVKFVFSLEHGYPRVALFGLLLRNHVSNDFAFDLFVFLGRMHFGSATLNVVDRAAQDLCFDKV